MRMKLSARLSGPKRKKPHVLVVVLLLHPLPASARRAPAVNREQSGFANGNHALRRYARVRY